MADELRKQLKESTEHINTINSHYSVFSIKDKNGNKLHVDNKVLLKGRNNLFEDNTIATVKFGTYNDDEAYTTLKHCGWYVEYYTENAGLQTHSLGDLIENCEKL